MYKLDDSRYATYSYDSLNRLNQRQLALGGNTNLYYNYIYKSSDRNTTDETIFRTTQISKEFIGNDVFIYSYDDLGNITSIKKATRSGENANSTSYAGAESFVSYKYDDLGQLTRENLAGKKTTVWNYDELGNITSKSEYTYTTDVDLAGKIPTKTVNYYYKEDDIPYEIEPETTKTYSSWNNLLLAVNLDGSEKVSNDELIEYDEIGNPKKYLGASLSWNGRELTSYKTSDKEISYTYDSNGLRASKTVKDGVTSKYFYVNGNLHYEERSDGTKLYFYYDSNGYLTGIEYNNTMYYPVTNKRGDVVAIYDSDGVCVAKYEYDAWGNIISVIDCDYYDATQEKIIEKDITNDTSSTDIAMVNPIRYRGYYYDTETKLYYLQSRYYNPEVGRFLNADSLLPDIGGEVMGYNMFSYCLNNPVNMSDPTGHWAKWLENTVKVASIVVAVAAVVTTVVTVSAFTAGTGTAAAVYGSTIFLGAALSGINGAVANEAKGNSYANGYLGGVTSGAIQSTCSKTPGGTILGGGAGVALGTAVTDTMNNLDPYSANSTAQEIASNAITSGGKALLTSSVTAYMGYASDLAVVDGASGLMPTYTYGFGEGVKAFFGWADDAIVYIWE